MSTQPLLFLGDKRRSALLARATESARRWRQRWVPQAAETFEATCEPPMPAGFVAPVASLVNSCWSLEISGERVAVLLLPHATFGWSVQEAGGLAAENVATAGSDSLVEKLEQEVARSLLGEFCADPRAPSTVERMATAQLAEWSRAVRAWTLNLNAAANGRNFTLLMSAARFESLAPARAVSRRDALESRGDAIGANAVALRAVAGEASMSVNDLAELSLDDVLVLDQRLGEPVALVSAVSGAVVAAASLGRSGARRAIKISGIPGHRN